VCGIGAIVKLSSSTLSKKEVADFNACIAHRGPDGEGITYHGSSDNAEDWQVALTHRRLSIIDLSDSGRQPMSYGGKWLWIVFNGEIYNYVELKDTLIRKGYSFQNKTDTEVILAAYTEWGLGCFTHLRGMWGIVICDLEKGILVASRDRMGIKPLYYHTGQAYVAFASEIKQFTTLPGFRPVANEAVVKQYILSGFERNDLTFFTGVVPVLPGTYVTLDINSLKISEPVSYWNPERLQGTISDLRQATEMFSTAFHESVKIHLRSDVAVGCQLSGGVDSSAVFALMSQYYTGEVMNSFTVTFPDFEKDESPFVRRMLEGSRAVAHFTTPTPERFAEDVRRFIWHHDEPVGSFAHYAGFELARLISESKTKVVLNGQGGDEILGGYWQQYYTYLFSCLKNLQLGKVISNLTGSIGRKGNEGLVLQAPWLLRRYRSRNRRNGFEFTPRFKDVPSLHFFEDYFRFSERERRIFEIRNLILPRLLKWDDRNLMAFGVEGRYPFLDHKVIETALCFDSSVLYRKGWTKYPLRAAMSGHVPESVRFRKSKWGFETPQHRWLASSLRPILEKWVQDDKPLDSVIDGGTLRKLVQNFWNKGTSEDAQMVLRLYLLDQWLLTFSVE
jgi:asparagine synthase (glutamine-hydrolysing)